MCIIDRACAVLSRQPLFRSKTYSQADTAMNIDAISVGPKPPYDIHVVIEIPAGGLPVKYEMDKESGALFVDRFLNTAMYYPGNYGFIPHTLADDGDPCDVIVINPTPVVPGAVIRARPIGVLLMEDEAGRDEKILAVPVDKLNPYYSDIQSYTQLPKILIEQIEHFFTCLLYTSPSPRDRG